MRYLVLAETFSRLHNVLLTMPEKYKHTGWFETIRLEGPLAIVSNGQMMVVEWTGYENPAEPRHFIYSPSLLSVAQTEAPFGNVIAFDDDTCVTTLAYSESGLICESNHKNPLDKWREKVPTDTLKKSGRGLFWRAEVIANLAKASPSGRLVFETNVDASEKRPAIVRDVNAPGWCGFYIPSDDDVKHEPATVPDWLKS